MPPAPIHTEGQLELTRPRRSPFGQCLIRKTREMNPSCCLGAKECGISYMLFSSSDQYSFFSSQILVMRLISSGI